MTNRMGLRTVVLVVGSMFGLGWAQTSSADPGCQLQTPVVARQLTMEVVGLNEDLAIEYEGHPWFTHLISDGQDLITATQQFEQMLRTNACQPELAAHLQQICSAQQHLQNLTQRAGAPACISRRQSRVAQLVTILEGRMNPGVVPPVVVPGNVGPIVPPQPQPHFPGQPIDGRFGPVGGRRQIDTIMPPPGLDFRGNNLPGNRFQGSPIVPQGPVGHRGRGARYGMNSVPSGPVMHYPQGPVGQSKNAHGVSLQLGNVRVQF